MTQPLSDQSNRGETMVPNLPNLRWGWRHPIRRVSWNLAWWLMRRVTMRDYTPHQQGRMIHDALGAYKPMPLVTYTGASNVAPTWRWQEGQNQC